MRTASKRLAALPMIASSAIAAGQTFATADCATVFDTAAMQALIGDLRSDDLLPGLHGLVIAHNGRLVVEEYFDGYRADRLHTQQSVSKSFTSALVGIALDRGDIAGVDDHVLDYFTGTDSIPHLDDRKRAMRLEDLLTMRSGTDYDEGFAGSPHSELNRLTRGWDRFYLGRPMLAQPGTRFQYDSGAVILFSAILKQRAGIHADRYARKHLLEPLGIADFRWDRNAEGHPHTGGGLYVTPRAMARFGQLYLDGGRYDDKQIIPESWVEESLKVQVHFDVSKWYGHGIGYGYWWWILEPDPAGSGRQTIAAALGFRGQHIFVIPEHSLVIAVTAGMSSGMHEPIRMLYDRILPALRRS